jgi:hypothetical protein
VPSFSVTCHDGGQVGTFLVRFSTSSPGFYTISKVASDGSIQHQRIIHHPNQPAFYMNNRVSPPLFPSFTLALHHL